jgi:molecular chaperone GrpE
MTDEGDEQVKELPDEITLEEEEDDPLKILEGKIEELEKERQYNAAEIINIRQRYARERNALVKFAGMNLAFNLLPVVDNLEKALAMENNDSDKFIEGVDMTLKRLKAMLENEGVVKIEALNNEFDPAFMEAIAVISAPEGEDPGVVLEVIEEGYMYHDRVLRPVKVIVSEN